MIFTFYSYKGGVGRTMALANIAELFYQAGLKVLMVDWDLEAPGLEHFFQNTLDPEEILDKLGIIDMLLEYKRQMAQPRTASEDEEATLPFENLEQFLVPIYPPAPEKGELWLLPAGRRSEGHFSKYVNAVLTLDWTDFYQNWEGERYFEWLRQQLNRMADVILIDSRTGVTEMGGVCSYHLADTVVMFCAPNQQNLQGTYKMARNFTSTKVQASRGERSLNVLIIPAKIDRAESKLLDEFQQEFTKLFGVFVSKAEGVNFKRIWQSGIPYIPKYSFSETVAVRESDRASSEDMVTAFHNLNQVMVNLWLSQLTHTRPELARALTLAFTKLDYEKVKTEELSSKENFKRALHRLLRSWHQETLPDPALLIDLHLYKNLANQMHSISFEPKYVIQQLITNALNILQTRDKTATNLLRRRFLDGAAVQQLSRELNISESLFFRLQVEAISQLTNIILEQEQQTLSERRQAIVARLEPPTYQRLHGVSQERQQLYEVITNQQAPWIVALDGIGGIGKTALANEVVRNIILTNQFYDIAWVTAKQQYFLPAAGLQKTDRPSLDVETLIDILLEQLSDVAYINLSSQEKVIVLTQILKKQPCLVVIDNLETIADSVALLPTIHKLANPAKFLLTSRHSLRAYPEIFSVSLRELSPVDVLDLIKEEAEVRGLTTLIEAPQEQLERIYNTVGGNPLALKLVIGQVSVLPSQQVLTNVQQAYGKNITELYGFIYRQAWQALSPSARQALLIMPLVSPQGSPFDQLAAISDLEPTELSQALEQLISLSLVEVRGDVQNRHYRIHRLTETFLFNEVTKWQQVSSK